MTELITVRRDDLHAVMARAGAEEWDPAGDPDFAEVWQRLSEAKDADLEPGEPSLPDGIYGRIEIPGYRENTGWVTEEPRFGMQMAVVRNGAGQVTAEVVLGPACRFVHLPVPQPQAERLALAAGEYEPSPPCICGPLASSDGEDIDERPDCPVHGLDEDPF